MQRLPILFTLGLCLYAQALVAQLTYTQPLFVEEIPATATYRLAGRTVHYKEMARYQRSIFSHGINLACNYADYELLNPKQWDSTAVGREILEIDLVYSKYPLDTADWRTPFTQLMTRRMWNILKLDPRFGAPNIRWNLVAQTACRNETEARQLFHGFVVKYRLNLTEVPEPEPALKQEEAFATVKLVVGGPEQKLPLLEGLFDRHPEWQHVTLVMDWSGSMYTFGANLINWYRFTQSKGRLENLVIFNDGDDFADARYRKPHKPLGQTRGFYTADPNNLEDVLTAIEFCMLSGDGGDGPENDVEALLYAQHTYKDADFLLLVADNSPIRDLELAPHIAKPVHILLVNPNAQMGVAEDYLELAWRTGGAIYTEQGEIQFNGPQSAIPREGILFLGQRYRLSVGGHLRHADS